MTNVTLISTEDQTANEARALAAAFHYHEARGEQEEADDALNAICELAEQATADADYNEAALNDAWDHATREEGVNNTLALILRALDCAD